MAWQEPPQVFISHGGNDLSEGFVRCVARAFKNEGFNIFIGSDEGRKRRDIKHIFRAIESSKVALVILSKRYPASELCLHEAVKIYDRRREGKLMVIPVFYKVSSEDVNMFNRKFGEYFLETLKIRGINVYPFVEIWMRNVNFIRRDTGFTTENYYRSYDDAYLVLEIVQTVKGRIQTNINHIFMEKQPVIREGLGSELLYASIAAFLCYIIIPFVFNDLDFFSIRQWFVAVLVWFVIRKSFPFILS